MGETDWAAVHRMESAANTMNNAAGRAEDAAHRLAVMLEDGYGGNGVRLIELLETDLAALRAQLAERDREIERLKADLASADMWAADHSEYVSPEAYAEMAAHANEGWSLLAASQAREREVVERADKVEHNWHWVFETLGIPKEADGSLDLDKAQPVLSALAAARKALEDLASAILRKNADGKPMHSRQGLNNIARAALKGDSQPTPDPTFQGLRDAILGAPEPPKED